MSPINGNVPRTSGHHDAVDAKVENSQTLIEMETRICQWQGRKKYDGICLNRSGVMLHGKVINGKQYIGW